MASRTQLCLPQPLRLQLCRWALDGYPRESCGLLLGRRSGDRTAIDAVRRARNLEVARASERYELDPLDHLAAENEAASLALELVGVWHSHPDHGALPSEIDRARAWSGWSYVIVSVSAAEAPDLRSWRLFENRFVEEELH